VPPTFADRLRRALRDDLRNPPYRLLRYERGSGPVVERDGIEMAVTVQGRLTASVIGYLTWNDQLSRHLWARVPSEALVGPAIRWRAKGEDLVWPVWHGLLQTAGGTGWLTSSEPVTEPGTGRVRHDDDAEAEHERRIAAVVAETRRQLDVVRLPSIEELDLDVRLNIKAADANARALALYYAVRGAQAEAQAVLDSAVEQHDALPDRPGQGPDEALRLRRFALWVRDTPVLARE
jgi:hypothetical protein